ncbi:MAG TPA: SBBP repeat-containing protein [Pyrinomonadaceae bacterium]|nr:SBBP repeat-containing protein [Pyrinomonadaceae bacterium]
MKFAGTHINRRPGLTLVMLCSLSSLFIPVAPAGRDALPRPAAQTDAALASSASASTPPDNAQARETYGQVPLSFESNRGQTESAVNFLARGAGYTLFLKPTEAVFVLARRDAETAQGQPEQRDRDGALRAGLTDVIPDAAGSKAPSVLRMRLMGANAGAPVEGAEEFAGKVNYFNGNDPARWRTNVPTFGRVRYSEVYPGIDLVYYGNQKQLEYDFVVAPGRDARAVSLQFEGADKVEVDARGDLLLTLGDDVIRQPKPVVYQEVAGARRAIEGGYAVGTNGRVGFAIGEYDARLPLVIDPVLVYSTYLGGSGGDQGLHIAVDSAGSAYIVGFTGSTNFPTANAVQAANGGVGGGFGDAFVSKLNPAGNALVYSTYLGGSGSEQGRGIAVDSAGSAYVTGVTNSTNFPTANAFDATLGSNGDDAFVTKLNPAGNALVYSTFLGGSDSAEFGQAITVDSAGAAYVTGSTFSNDFPTLNPIQATYSGGSTDAFLSKLNAAGSALVYSTYLGGNDNDSGEGIKVDSAGNAYVGGDTFSTNFPTLSPIQAANGGNGDTFVLKVNPGGNALVYSTYLGGSARDACEDLAIDSAGNVYTTGDTESMNFPTANAFQAANGGTTLAQDAFVTKINAAGNALVFSTYLGGTGGEIGFGIAVDSSGNVYVAGGTGSNTTFPTANAIQCARAGSADVFATKFNAAGSALFYSTYIGGNDDDQARGIALDPAGNAYIAGRTSSTNYPTVNAFQSAFGGETPPFGDAFVTKISDAPAGPASQLLFTQTAPSVQEDVTSLTLTVQRTGDTSGPVSVNYATADGTASERSDYTTALGTLQFAAGETAKNIVLLINEDSKVEGNETFTVALSNPTGGATLSCPTAIATVQITDDAAEPSTNVIDEATIFVGQHYHDFLNRQADADGLAFWTNQITSCGADAACVDDRRQNVSAAFFLSMEFQGTGYEVIRIYKASFTDSAARPRGLPRYREFLRDTQEIRRGVVVNIGNWEQQLESNTLDFARRWVQSTEFMALFPPTMTAEQFVDKLFQNSEVTPTQGERDAAIAAFGTGGTDGRARALLSVIRSKSVYNRQYNPAFVLMQYIGYLRRNPNDAPDNSYVGYDFWLAKMNSFSLPGEDVSNDTVALSRVRRADMVKAFIISGEYRGRFGQ